MSKLYLILVLTLVSTAFNAQTITFSDPAFKAKLLQSDPSNTIARNLSDDYFAIDVNKNGEIENSEALQVLHLEVDNSNISSLLGIENFLNINSLKCSNNQISNLDISKLTLIKNLLCDNNTLNTLTLTGANHLERLYCQSNQLVSLNADNLTNLISIDCSSNKLTSINLINLNKLESLICNSNKLASLFLDDMINLVTLECNRNLLSTLDLNNITNITSLDCSYNQLVSLDASTLIDLTSLYCTNNLLTSLVLDGLNRLAYLYCNNNQLTTLNTISLSAITFLNCNTNNIQSIQLGGLIYLKFVDIAKNQIANLDTNGLNKLQYLYCNNNKLTTLDLTNQYELQTLFAYDNILNSLYLKNGSNEEILLLSGNPNLNYICADESEINFIQEEIANNGYTNCFATSYCTFVPGGVYYTIEGTNKFDSNANGCDNLDLNFPNLKLNITDTNSSFAFISDSTGTFSIGVKEGTYTITPTVENSNYYTITPSSSTVSFPNALSSFPASFCIVPKGNFYDLEITIIPLDNDQINFESKYKLIYKNKGTITQSGTVNLLFDGNALNLVSANPVVSSQNTSNLIWNFSNLLPQETRFIEVTLITKPSVVNGYMLQYNSTITNNADETPNDNISELTQEVVSNVNLNDKIALEGTSISSSKVGDFMHYLIRFENSGTAIAQYIVLKDLIDSTKFDVSTLVPINSSHPFVTKINSEGTVEFIFENINLSNIVGANNGYIAFKIKTLSSLLIGDNISNSASIYFDYLQPIATNVASTNVLNLKTQEYTAATNVISDLFTIFPNPVKDILKISNKENIEISSIIVYNTLGQQVLSFVNTSNNLSAIDVSKLTKGLYFIKINCKKGVVFSKLIKE